MDGSNAKVFESAQTFEAALCEASLQGVLILTARPRLARRLLHRVRLLLVERNGGSPQGWETPPIQSFAGWARQSYDMLWRPHRPLGRMTALALWEQAVRDVAPPDGLDPTPSLFSHLQTTLDLLEAHGLPAWESRPTEAPLPRWRSRVTRRFLELKKERGLASWNDILAEVSAAVSGQRLAVPERIVFAGFEESAPQETAVFDALAGAARVSRWAVQRQDAAAGGLHVYATPEQECRSVCAQILTAWNGGVKNMGIAFLDPDYFPLLQKYLAELAGLGENPDLEHEIRYNLATGTPLAEHPLIQWALLPLRILESPQPLPLCASLLASPYARRPGPAKAAALLRPLLRLRSPLSLMEIFRAWQGGPLHPLAEAMQALAHRQRQPMAHWLSSLQRTWSALGLSSFGASSPEEDISARDHLRGIVEALHREAAPVETNAAGVTGWLTAACEGVWVARKSVETVGIQVLPALDACGLAFEHLWVVGAHGGVLPRTADPLPLVAPRDREQIPQGTDEGRWDSAERLVGVLRAGAGSVEFSRSLSAGEDTPYLPTPLLPDEEGEPGVLDLWGGSCREWVRAHWLRSSLQGLGKPPSESSAEEEKLEEGLSGSWSVTRLQHLTACPYQFFAGDVLGLEPLEFPAPGLDPARRGSLIHKALKLFAEGLADNAPDWPGDGAAAQRWLRRVVDIVLAELPDSPPRRAEHLRLLGEAPGEGILISWLEQERLRARDGWSFAAAELSFAGLQVGGLSLKGRIDRVDCSHQGGVAVWDYKTGEPPGSEEVETALTELQVPAYLDALRRGAVEGFDAAGRPLSGGYISLKDPDKIKVESLKPGGGWNEFLDRWESLLAERLLPARSGAFPARPTPKPTGINDRDKSACRYCSFFNLCGYFDDPANAGAGLDESGSDS